MTKQESKPAMFAGMFTDKVRERNCTRCGSTFTQYQLSPAFLRSITAQPQRTQERWAAMVPDNALPIYCVPCERKDLASSSVVPRFPGAEGVSYG